MVDHFKAELEKIRDDLIAMCEDNIVMEECIDEYFKKEYGLED